MICSIKNSARMMDGIIIREARREDCKEIRRLIQELAEFEKMKNAPKIDHTGYHLYCLWMLVLLVGLFQELANYSQKSEDIRIDARSLFTVPLPKDIRLEQGSVTRYTTVFHSRASSIGLAFRALGEDESWQWRMFEAEVLEEDGFNSQHPYFHCFVAEPSPEDGGDAVVPDNGASGTSSAAGDVTNTNALLGYAVFYYSYSTWEGKSLYLEDLYVTPSCRGQGLGSALFNRVAKRAFETGCSRLDFAVLDWNPARVFYKEKGAIDLTEEEGWHHYRLSRDVLEHIAAQGVSKANVTNE